jgi:hypothetical protein
MKRQITLEEAMARSSDLDELKTLIASAQSGGAVTAAARAARRPEAGG